MTITVQRPRTPTAIGFVASIGRSLWWALCRLARAPRPAAQGDALLPPHVRSRHRLMQRPDGSARCSACLLCRDRCPAQCITIEAAGEGDARHPTCFAIDWGRCLFCGECAACCPDDAIRMDSGLRLPRAEEARVAEMDELLANTPAGTSPLSRAL